MIEHLVDRFLSTCPNGCVRKETRRVDGINYSKKREVERAESNHSVSSVTDKKVPNSDEELEQIQSVDEINLTNVLSDEWSESGEVD